MIPKPDASQASRRLELTGRSVECDVLDRVARDITGGQSTVLVLRGEAGVGKTALLDFLAVGAYGCQVARAAGVESEMELAYSGLQQLCAPMLDRLVGIPEPQRNALSTAFGMRVGTPPDRFLVGLAALSLLAAAAVDQPLICVIDDAQWLDRISAETMTFIARRLGADRVALIFAVRDSSGDDVLAGLPELEIGGLRDDDARALLDSAFLGRLDGPIRDRIVAETRGNPLALLELPRGRSPAELAGGFGRPDARRLASKIEESFAHRLKSLPAATQRLLLLAAAEPLGDVALLRRAAEGLGIAWGAAAPAEAADLIDLGAGVRFRHPLVRSAAYRSANVVARRTVHGALAEATDREADPDRRAWHAAHSASEPDEEIAGELERSAGRARARGGVAAEAAFLRRAAELTPVPALRGARALGAAEVQIEAAAPEAAYDLLTIAEQGPLGDLQRARVLRLRARIVFSRSRGTEAAPILLAAARRMETLDEGSARETYLEALGTTIFAGRLGSGQIHLEAARTARSAPAGPHAPTPVDLLLDGVATRLTDGYVAAVPGLRATPCAVRRTSRSGCGWRGFWPPTSGTTRPPTNWPRGRCELPAIPAR